jgi:hypothetical protein
MVQTNSVTALAAAMAGPRHPSIKASEKRTHKKYRLTLGLDFFNFIPFTLLFQVPVHEGYLSFRLEKTYCQKTDDY